MIQNPTYRVILRSIFAAVMQSNLSASDLRSLASELRRGRLSGELAYLLDEVNQHFEDTSDRRHASDQLWEAERIMKERKLSKLALINIVRSIDGNITPKESATTRSILQEFLTSATPRESEKLLDTLKAAGVSDPYLKGISETRR